jgi:glycosyltransferase involved in cell wall biosynthesis
MKHKLVYIQTCREPLTGGELVEKEILATLRDTGLVDVIDFTIVLRASQYEGGQINRIGTLILSCVRLFLLSIRAIFDKDYLLYDYDIRYVQPPANLRLVRKDHFRYYGEQLIRFSTGLLRMANRKKLRLHLFNSNWTKTRCGGTNDGNGVILYPPVRPYPSLEEKVKNLVLTVARFSPAKELDVVGRMSEVLESHQFVVIGFNSRRHNSYLEYLRGTYPRITFLENASDEIKRAWLAKAEFYLSVTTEEPFGMAIVEGMGSGCIPVVHDSGGAMEFVPQEFRFRTFDEAVQLLTVTDRSHSVDIITKLASEFSPDRFAAKLEAQFRDFLVARQARSSLRLKAATKAQQRCAVQVSRPTRNFGVKNSHNA